MKKKKKSKLSHINDLDNIFSEIDVKADTINNTNNDNIKLYSLDVLSDISDNLSNNSIDLNDYDLEMDTMPPVISVQNDTITVNTQDFFNCLLNIDDETSISKKQQKEFVEPEKFKIKYINEMSDLINIIPEKLIVNKIDNTQNENNQQTTNQQTTNQQTTNQQNTNQQNTNQQNTNQQNMNQENMNQENMNHENMNHENMNHENMNHENMNQENNDLSTTNYQNMNEPIRNHENMNEPIRNHENMNHENNDLSSINKKLDDINIKLSETNYSVNDKNKEIICNSNGEKELGDILENKDIKNITTSEKQDIWGDLKTNILSSYNYLCSESQNINCDIDNYKLKGFYLEALNDNKNRRGYIENDCINSCFDSKDYKFEIYTKISDNNDIDPPGNYLNIFLNKDLDITKKLYLLCNSGYWILEPLENYKKLVKNNVTNKLLKIYFIVIKLLYCNKHYPFDSGDCIKKYKILVKNINVNLIVSYVNNDLDFKEYINNQLNNVFNIQENINNLVDMYNLNNINKYYTNILKLKYNSY